MINERIVSAKTETQAKDRVALEFGVESDKLTCVLLEEAKKGIFGLGAQDAKFKITYDDGKPEPEAVKAPKEEKKAPEIEKKPEAKPEPKAKPEKKPEIRPAAKPEVKPEAKPQIKLSNTTPMTAADYIKGLDKVISFVDMILADMKLDAKTKFIKADEEDIYLEITGESLGMIIGHHGEVLDSIQYLANIVRDNEKGDDRRIHVDIENYRSKREETLNKLADRMAAKVLANGRSITLEPMNPYERRIIHSRIQGIAGVTTRSVGVDLNRRVVIYSEKNGMNASREKDDRRVDKARSEGCYDRFTEPSNKK